MRALNSHLPPDTVCKTAISPANSDGFAASLTILDNPKYYDPAAFDEHIEVGGTSTAQMGFAGCALPVVLSHNTPNNSVYMLWGSEAHGFPGLFPRVSRHKEF